MKYLARYTHRVAISNRRLVSLENGKVTFLWKDYAQGNRSRTMTLDAAEFIRRFLLHSLPKGFQRIRQYGFLANRVRQQKLSLCRELLTDSNEGIMPGDRITPERSDTDAVSGQESMATQGLCSVCQKGRMAVVEIIEADGRCRQELPAPQSFDTS